jgi:hypothetical protein
MHADTDRGKIESVPSEENDGSAVAGVATAAAAAAAAADGAAAVAAAAAAVFALPLPAASFSHLRACTSLSQCRLQGNTDT